MIWSVIIIGALIGCLCGMAVYESGKGTSLVGAERLADDRMYARKTELKEQNSN